MILGYFFFGECSVQLCYFWWIGLCIVFYSVLFLLYIMLFIYINVELLLKNLLQKFVFYYLWFFFVIVVIYLFLLLIQVKFISSIMLLVLMVIFGILVNFNMVSVKVVGIEWLLVNFYINGDIFYYVFYGVLGRVIGILDIDKKWLILFCVVLFIVVVWVIFCGMLYELCWCGDFGDIWYFYCGLVVFVCVVILLMLVKNWFNVCFLFGIVCIV